MCEFQGYAVSLMGFRHRYHLSGGKAGFLFLPFKPVLRFYDEGGKSFELYLLADFAFTVGEATSPFPEVPRDKVAAFEEWACLLAESVVFKNKERMQKALFKNFVAGLGVSKSSCLVSGFAV